MSSLQSVEIDNNSFVGWEIPESLTKASTLQNFSADSATISGHIPEFLGPNEFLGLVNLHLAFNSLVGGLPLSFLGSLIESFWVNGQKGDGTLGGGIDVIHNMTYLKEVWLHSNGFSGPLPNFSGLKGLESLSLRDNAFTSVVPMSLVNLGSLKVVNLTNNLLQGPMPEFNSSVVVDMVKETNSFCLPIPGECDPRVNTLLSVVKSMDFRKIGLKGTISPKLFALKSLQRLVLAENNLTDTIPEELTTLPALTELDVSNNQLYGKVPAFKSNLILKTDGNPDIGKEKNDTTSQGPHSQGSSGTASGPGTVNDGLGGKRSKNKTAAIVLSVIGGVFLIFLIGVATFCLYTHKQKRFTRVQSPNAMVVHPRHSGGDNESVKITVAGSNVSVGAVCETQTIPGSESSDIQMVEAGNMVISIQVLEKVMNNFSQENILGHGGFGIVYRGELHDGTKIVVKRMELGVIAGKGLAEFKFEIAVLTKVRHRHLCALLGYCLDGNKKLLVYENMPQEALSKHLFNWPEEGLKPLEWTRRLAIGLDVARDVEYLHGLAHQSFIHMDLKPSNILSLFN
ncbi:hypothetical protein RJ640_010625 [Escallonia rubra]|uniref:Protein kinase domain-containing protein n=1 Tax=Escallonia rubra TaxID=112253 RepID=A0AA88REA9_9ASTE|nr:hypothetical protein RJ640_010625 [Escallonia rubra]